MHRSYFSSHFRYAAEKDFSASYLRYPSALCWSLEFELNIIPQRKALVEEIAKNYSVSFDK